VSDQARITFEEESAVLVVRISGEVDLSNASVLERAIVEAVPNTLLGMVVDLSGVGYLDSAGVRMLANLAERFRWRQQQLRVAAPDGSRVRAVLSMAGADDLAPLDLTADVARERILGSSGGGSQGEDADGGGPEPRA
jgi:stage II sporulation protein AA (anti-sigma F factor antagonist)